MLRAIAAVVAGYVSIVLVLFPTFTAIYLTIGADGAFQPGKYEISTLWYACAVVVNGLGAVAGGWVCAKIASSTRPPQVLAGILLGLGLLLGIGKLFGPADIRPTERDGSVGNLEAMKNAREPISFAFLTPFIGFGGALLGARLVRRKGESSGGGTSGGESTGGASSSSRTPTAAWLLIASGAATLLAPTYSAAAGADDVYFETQIRPILKARCWHCHGEEPELAGKLDLRLARKIASGGESGPAFVAGKPAESLLWQRIEKGEMPPGDKKLSRSELDLLRRWIEQGARTARPEPQTDLPPGAFSDEERSHWAFQPVAAPTVPSVTRTDSLRSPIDSFVQQQLEPLGATLATPAERAVLLRRLAIDLVGLPPSPEDAAEFQADSAPDAYARAVDRLIASPRYGERWGRHWLDIAGYADSDGYTERDPERKYAYKYRDYVIRSLNADKPWSEFIVEQLAGDELLTPPYSNLTPEQADKLIATGFLRCGPDGTGDGGVDQAAARNDVMAETLKIVSTSLLGLSVGCAQCHNHRFDPISQVDYYRLRAVFEPGYDVSNWRAPNARLVSLWSDEQRKLAADVDSEVKKIAAEKNADMEQIINDILEREVAKLPEELRQPAREARATDAKKRTPEQQKLLKEYPSLLVTSSSAYLYDQKRVDAHQKKFAELTTAAQAKKPPEDFVQCLTEVPGKIPATKVFFRGDHRQPREAVEPAELAVLNTTHAAPLPADDPALQTSGRRLAYARQLTDGRHPLVGRVLVNRFWMHHFGRGLVASPADFGAQGERPTHPELLDWLVTSFTSPTVPRGGWSLKNLHREIVMSSTFKQSSRRPESLASRDPDNRLLGRMSVRRLDAEVIRDSILATSGVINGRAFGPAVPVSPDEVGQVTIGVDTRDTAGRPTGKSRSIGGEEFRRSVFVQVRRTLPLEMLEMFDAPTPTPNCESRTPSTVAPQALMLLNNEFVIAQSELFAKRVQEEAGPDPVSQAARAWQIAFGAQPAPAELEDLVKFMAEQTQIYRDLQAEQAAAKNAADADSASKTANKAANAKKGGEKKTETVHPPEFHALANLCQGLLSSNLFLYVE